MIGDVFQRQRRRIPRGSLFAASFLAVTFVLGGVNAPPSLGSGPLTLQGTHYFGDGVSVPLDVVGDGGDLWIADDGSYAVAELSESDGALEAISPLPSASGNPSAIAVDGPYVWVVSYYGGQLTELSRATGAVLSVISIPGENCPCDGPSPLTAISDDGSHVWITEGDPPYSGTLVEVDASTDTIVQSDTYGDESEPFQPRALVSDGTSVWVATNTGVDEFSATSGHLEATILGPEDELEGATGVSVDGTHVWVTTAHSVVELSESTAGYLGSIDTPPVVGGESGLSSDGKDLWVITSDSLIEISESSGTLLRILAGTRYGIAGATGVVSDGTKVWIVDDGPGSLTEISASSGQVLSPISAAYDLFDPGPIAGGGSHVWVLDTNGDSVIALTELSAITGEQLRFAKVPADAIGYPCQFIDDGPDLWVLAVNPDGSGDSLVEFRATTGVVLGLFNVGGSSGCSSQVALTGGRLWVLTTATHLQEYSASSGRYLGSTTASSLGLRGGIFGMTSAPGLVIAVGASRLAVASSSSGKLVQLFARSPRCVPPACSIALVGSTANTVWAIQSSASSGGTLIRYSLRTGANLNNFAMDSTGLNFSNSIFVAGGELWLIGRIDDDGPNQGWSVQERSSISGSLVRSYSGGRFGIQSPYPSGALVLGSQFWVPDSDGNSVTEFQFAA